MPAIKVFDFVQRVKEFIHDKLSHNTWIVKRIVLPYSKRFKNTLYGYKVVPLEVLVIAYDKATKDNTKYRMSFDALCELISRDEHSLPYINVNQTKDNSRKIYEDGFTVLDIDCSRIEDYNGSKYYKHNTVNLNLNRFAKLNEEVLKIINERISIYKKCRKEKMDEMMLAILAEDELCDVERQLDIDDMCYGYHNVEGGYKD